jgi:hypothetical protein
MNLSLDLSTSCTGVCITDKEAKIVRKEAIVLSKIKGDDAFWAKADRMKEYLRDLQGIENIIIEEPMFNGPNQFTTNLLIRFNGVVSYICREELGITPTYLSVHEVRKTVCPEFIKRETKKGKIVETFFMPKGLDKKLYIFNKIKAWFPELEWELNKKGDLKPENLDISDSIAVNLAYLLKENTITLKDLGI